ncbi:MAG TPA: hypothetical protein VFI95_21465 [Terriglobales bacterium]|nr:hypothetical protein [Terriglobales bacterium]
MLLTRPVQTAIDAGADSIEHGNEITEEQLKQMRAKGMFFDFTPTSYGLSSANASRQRLRRIQRCELSASEPMSVTGNGMTIWLSGF